MTRVEDPEVAKALLGAHAAHLSPEGAAMLKRRLDMGSCLDRQQRRFNLGALKNLRFGYGERNSLSIGEGSLPGDVIAEHQKNFRRGIVSWVPPGAIPNDSSERVRLYEERRAYAVEQREKLGAGPDPLNPTDDDLLGVGLASFPTLELAADELMRFIFRAAPRDWSGVSAAELRVLDRYPDLARMPIPTAPELTAPLGWVPGAGPSPAAEEMFRKLSADWEGFGSIVPAVGAADVEAWQSFSEAWRKSKLLPTELGERLLGEARRAQRIRGARVHPQIAEEASPVFGELGEAASEEPEEEGGIRGFFAKVVSPQMVTAGVFLTGLAATLFSSSSSTRSESEAPRLPPKSESGGSDSDEEPLG
jgi:hypothetical protein